MDIELTPENLLLGEVLVKSKREKDEERDIGVSQLETRLIYDTPFVEPDVLRALQFCLVCKRPPIYPAECIFAVEARIKH